MDFLGYRLEERNNRVIIEGIENFNPVHTFECGQCFRWEKQADGSYNGIAGGRPINVAYDGRSLVIYNTDIEDFKNFWFNYFDFGTDYSEIKKQIGKDDHMKAAIEYGYGIRILRQDIWEMLVSYIISANNKIPGIIKIVANLARMYGRAVPMDEAAFHAFPEPGDLSGTSLETLVTCKAGFRCKYILKAAALVNEGGINLSALSGMDTHSARQELMKLPGVGPKVADCILLYGGVRFDVFPTDVWVKRVMEKLYFGREAGFAEIQAFSSEYFGSLRGYAQQYLFYYARELKIGADRKLSGMVRTN